MSEESIAVEPSEENGNVPLDTPSEQPIEAVVTPEVVASEPKLYDLPDGRKVDGETLAKEWKDNFLPDYTKKSQTLAEIERAKAQNKPNETIEDPYAKPDYVPKSYREVIDIAKQEALKEQNLKEQQAIEREQQIENEVTNQLNAVKALDKNLNEDALFLHANEYRAKYGVAFPDLQSAYKHMKDVESLTKTVQQTTVKNIQKHADAVSTTQQRATGGLPNPAHYSSAQDYLKAVQSVVK